MPNDFLEFEGRKSMYFKKIEGEKIYLSPIDVNDYELYAKWMNDYKTSRYIKQYTNVINAASEKEFLEKLAVTPYNFAIVLKNNDKLIGNVSLVNIDNINQTAELGIFIGDDENRHHGYGTEAIKLMLNYAFNYLNLNNIFLSVYALNKNAYEAYQKIGFKTIGVRHECFYFEGKLQDEIFMELLKADYESL